MFLIHVCICSIRAFLTLLTTHGVKKKIPIVPYHSVLRDTIIAQSIGPNWVLHSYLYWRCSPHLECCGKIRPFYVLSWAFNYYMTPWNRIPELYIKPFRSLKRMKHLFCKKIGSAKKIFKESKTFEEAAKM